MEELINDMQEADKQAEKGKVAEQADREYSAEISLDLTVRTAGNIDDVTYDNKITVSYNIEVEYRTWGIKGYELYVTKPVTIEYETESGESKSITIEPIKIDIEWQTGATVSPYDLYVQIEDDKLDVATLSASFIDKG